MASFRKSFSNSSYLQSSLTILLFFGSWGIWWSFFEPWLSNPESGLGLSGAQVGRIYSTNALATLIIMFFYGTIQDKLGLKRHLAVLAAVVMTLVGPFFVFVYEPLLRSTFMLGVVVGAVVLSLGFMSAVGLFEALTERFSRAFGFEYGQARMWGSFGYALVALAAGILFSVNPHLNFWVGSGFGLACLLVLLLWKTREVPVVHTAHGDEVVDEASTPGIREMAGLLRMPSLC